MTDRGLEVKIDNRVERLVRKTQNRWADNFGIATAIFNTAGVSFRPT